MATLRLRLSIEIESEGLDEKALQSIEVQVARFSENLEARLSENIRIANPGLEVRFLDPEEES
jgi:hypothetical protein